MRNTTKTFVASVGMGICAISYAIGANSAVGSSFSLGALNTNSGSGNPTVGVSDNPGASNTSSSSAQPSSSGSATTKTSASHSPKTSSSSSAQPSNSSSNTTTAAAKKKTKKTTKKTTTTGSSSGPTPAPTHTSSNTPTPKPSTSTPPPSNTTVTKTGAVFNDNDRWGDFAQVSVTKTNGKVTAVNVVSSYATSQWQSAYPYLAQLAVASNGSRVASLSGATYASAAFNGALASAMSKF